MATITWGGASGDWANAADWLGGKLPGVADTALIGGSAKVSVTMNAPETVGSFELNDANATFTLSDDLTLGSRMALTAGKFRLRSGGTISGGTIKATGAGVEWDGGTLDGVTFAGPLDMSADQSVIGVSKSLTLTGASDSGPGEVDLSGYSSRLVFVDSQTFTNATVNIGNSKNYPTAYLGVAVGSGITLKLGSTLVVNQTGVDGYIDTSGATDTIINYGHINADYKQTRFPNGGMTIGDRGTFVNKGTITVTSGDSLDIQPGAFSNQGLITVSGTGKLFLDGVAKTADLGTIVDTGATNPILLSGTIDNTGAVLSVGSGSALGVLSIAGTITGGAIVDGGSGFRADQATLNGVKFEGVLDLSDDHAMLKVDNGINLTGASGAGKGTIKLTGYGSYLRFYGTQSLTNAVVDIGGSYGPYGSAILQAMEASDTGVSLTLAASTTINHTGIQAVLLTGYAASDTIINRGRINAAHKVQGGYVHIQGAGVFENLGVITVAKGDDLEIESGSFSNPGQITVTTGGTLGLDTTLTTAGLANIVNSGGTIGIGSATSNKYGFTPAGTIVNTGGTLTLGAGSKLGVLALIKGEIDGGVIVDPGDGLVGKNGTLGGVVVQGTLGMAAAYSKLKVTNGLRLTGASGTGRGEIDMSGRGDLLSFYGTQTLSGVNLNIGDDGAGRTQKIELSDTSAPGGSTLTLAANATLTHTGGDAFLLAGGNGGYAGGLATDTIVNKGRINATAASGYLHVEGAGVLVNDGVINAGKGDELIVSSGSFTNAGAVNLAKGGSLVIEAAMVTADLGSITNTGGTLALAGTINNAGSTLTVGAGSKVGVVHLVDGVVKGGIIVDGGSGLLAQGGTINGVTFEGTLDLSAVSANLNVTNGVTLTGAGGVGPGRIDLTGGEASLNFYGSQTLTNAAIEFGGLNGDGLANLRLKDPSGAGATLTLAPSVTITHAGSHADIYTGTQSHDTVVNQGLIDAAGGYFGVTGAGTFVNQGTIDLSGGNLAAIDTGRFLNTGLLEVNGANLIIYTPLQNFAGHVLTGGVFEVVGNAKLVLPTNDTVKTDASTIILSGAGSTVETYNAATKALVALDASLTSIAASGTLELLAGRVWSGTGALTNSGHIMLDGAGSSVAKVSNAGTISGDGAIVGSVSNTGLIQASGAGGLTLTGAVNNTGTLATMGHNLVVDGAVTGGGAVVIKGGAADFLGAFSQDVIFQGAGVLELSDAQNYAGTITGFSTTGANSLDLSKIAFVAGAKATYSGTATSGTLTVVSGAQTAKIKLSGNFTSSTFTVSSDGHGGTKVVDPPRSSVSGLVVAAAAFAPKAAGTSVVRPDENRTLAPLIASPR